jgi:CDP-glycerol glycerophosphotransferase (TagB/SpsB family)
MPVVYFDSIPTSENLEYIASITSNGKSPIKYFAPAGIRAKKLSVKTAVFELDEITKAEINKEVLEQILKFPNKQVSDSDIRSAYTINNIECWHYVKFRTYFRVREIRYKEHIANRLVSEHGSLLFVTNESLLKESECLKIIQPSNSNKKWRGLITLIKYGVFVTLRSLNFSLKSIKNIKHLLVDCSLHRDMLSLQLKKIKGNYIIDYILEDLPKNFAVLNKREIPKFDGSSKFSFGLKDIFPGRKVIPDEGVLLSGLLNSKIRRQANSDYQELVRSIHTIQIQDLSEQEALILKASKFFLNSVKIFILLRHGYDKLFKNYPGLMSITTTDEHSPLQKCMLDAAKNNNVKTIALQHGAIFEMHGAYRFSKRDVELETIPDYTLIWGELTRKTLIDHCNYPYESVKMIGQVRTDIIPILEKTNLNPLLPKEIQARKTILFASQPQPDEQLRYRAAEDVFTMANEIQDAVLVLKPHPAEINNLEYYINIAKKTGCSNYIIAEKIDLYLLLAASEIVITCYSTVGAEAIYFNKPLIILDHLKQDVQNYHSQKVAFQTTNSYELQETTKDLLSGKKMINREAYRVFIKDYAFKIDGEVKTRFYEFVKQLE